MKKKRVASLILALVMAFSVVTSAMAEGFTLRYGSKGTAVTQLQQMLMQLSYTTVVDGVYGAGTRVAVQQYQMNMGLAVDGIAGPQTITLLQKQTNSSYAATSALGVFHGNYGTMTRGESSTRVRTLQEALNILGYSVGKVDGSYGAATEAAVRWFQLVQGLTPDSKAGATTLQRMESFLYADGSLRPGYTPPAVTSPAQPEPTPTPELGGALTRVLRQGDEGEDVRTVQNRLKSLGYYTGSLDGKFGASTTAAVMQFQLRNGIEVDGVVGTVTCTVLFSSGAVAAAPSTTPSYGTIPTRTLSLGDTGNDVRSVQNRLKSLGYYNGSVDGKFGATTRDAVVLFQQRNGLSVDGKAGPKTNAVLFSANALPALTGTMPQMVIPSRVLRPGDTGADVLNVQWRLQTLGYYAGALDGLYGASTMEAVMHFQQRHGLTADGKAGPQTNALLFSGSAQPSETGATPTPTPQLTVPGRTLREGDTGADVLSLQTRLQSLGYYAGVLDGHYGTDTTNAVTLFQIRHGIAADGVAGPTTYAILYSDAAIPLIGDPTPTATPDPATGIPTRTLRQGDTGADVASVQTRLKELGFFTGLIDGVYGASTTAAVTAFQIAYGLKPDGVAGPLTYALLYGALATTPPATETPTAVPTTPATTVPDTTVTLRKGATGPQVTLLQTTLLNLGYTVNTNSTYTNETVTAVRQFQTNNGLSVDGVAGPNTLTKLYSGTAVGPSTPTANDPGEPAPGAGILANPPANSDVQLLHWYRQIKPSLSGQPTVRIYDPASGLSWNIKIFSMGHHADGEPPTLQDTQIMYKAFGNQFTWNEKPVFVQLPSGVWCIASMHDHPHESDMIKPSVNGFSMVEDGVTETGHLCIHFPRDMAETMANDPKNGVRHQNDIRKKWKEMTGQDIPW